MEKTQLKVLNEAKLRTSNYILEVMLHKEQKKSECDSVRQNT